MLLKVIGISEAQNRCRSWTFSSSVTIFITPTFNMFTSYTHLHEATNNIILELLCVMGIHIVSVLNIRVYHNVAVHKTPEHQLVSVCVVRWEMWTHHLNFSFFKLRFPDRLQ